MYILSEIFTDIILRKLNFLCKASIIIEMMKLDFFKQKLHATIFDICYLGFKINFRALVLEVINYKIILFYITLYMLTTPFFHISLLDNIISITCIQWFYIQFQTNIPRVHVLVSNSCQYLTLSSYIHAKITICLLNTNCVTLHIV